MVAPSVSIILPFRDAVSTLTECMDSIAGQSLQTFECLAIDDHSTDGSAELIHHYADDRFRVLTNPGDGLVDALNHGLAQARSNTIARMDADDIMHAQRLEQQFAFLENNPDTDLIACCVEKFPEHLIQAGYREYIRWQNLCLSADDVELQIYIESPFAHPAVMYRRDVVERLGNYRDGEFPEDYDLWLRMHQAGCTMQKLPAVLLHWRESVTRLSRVSTRYSRQAFDRLRAEYLAHDPRLAGDRPLALWGAGRKTRRRAEHLLNRGFTPMVWIDIDPKKIGNRIDGIEVVAPHWLKREPKPFVLAYVTNHGARAAIDTELAALGYLAGTDYLHIG